MTMKQESEEFLLAPIFNNLNELSKYISKKINIPCAIDAMFTESFMKTNTESLSIWDFLEPLGIKSNEELNSLPTSKLDEYVSLKTKFSSWEEMKQAASKELIGN